MNQFAMAMIKGLSFTLFAFLVMGACLLPLGGLRAEQITVRYTEGLSHGFLAIRTLEDKLLADGEITQVAKGDRVTSRVFFRFKDGSIYDDTAIFSQRGSFRLLSDHLVEKGPSFKHPMETLLEASTGEVTVHYTDEDGKEKTINERLDMPADVANGLLMMLVKHI